MVSLTKVDSNVPDRIKQFRGFYEFGNGAFTHGFTDIADRLDQGEVGLVIEDILDQKTIDFQEVHR